MPQSRILLPAPDGLEPKRGDRSICARHDLLTPPKQSSFFFGSRVLMILCGFQILRLRNENANTHNTARRLESVCGSLWAWVAKPRGPQAHLHIPDILSSIQSAYIPIARKTLFRDVDADYQHLRAFTYSCILLTLICFSRQYSISCSSWSAFAFTLASLSHEPMSVWVSLWLKVYKLYLRWASK